MSTNSFQLTAFSALTLLVGQQEGHLACKKTEWWGAGVFICLERGADLHMAQLMPLPLTVSCFSKIQIGFTFKTFLVPAHLGSPRKGPLNGCVCVLSTNWYAAASVIASVCILLLFAGKDTLLVYLSCWSTICEYQLMQRVSTIHYH